MTEELVALNLEDECDNKENQELLKLLEENIDDTNGYDNTDVEDFLPFFTVRNEIIKIASIIKKQMNTLQNGISETNSKNSDSEIHFANHFISEIFSQLHKESDEKSPLPVENLTQDIIKNIFNIYNITTESSSDRDFNYFEHENIHKTSKSVNNKHKDNIEDDIPLFIKDILQLKIDSRDTRIFTTFNTKFRTVLVHGIIYKQYARTFMLDDGTGSILIKCSNEKLFPIINKLRNELNNKMLSAQLTKNKNEIRLISSLDRLLKEVEKQINITQNLKNGSRVFVQGKPCINQNSQIYLRIFDIEIDNNSNCDKELFFKRDLIRYYTSYYHKDKKIGDGDEKK